MNKKHFLVLIFASLMFAIPVSVYADAIDDAVQRLNNSDDDVREDAAAYLGNQRNERAVPALIEALGDSEEDVREEAAKALGRIGSADSVPALINALHDDDFGVRRQVIKALDLIGDPRAVEPLEALSKTTGNPWTSDEALQAATNIRMRKLDAQ